MKAGTMFPSRWLTAADAEDDDLILTIRKVRQEIVGQGEDAGEKFVVYFSDHDKGLVLNKTNVKTLVDLYGDETDNWTGKRIALFATDVQFKGEMKPAIRIRPRVPKSNGATGRPKSKPADDDEEDAFAAGDDDE